MPTSILLNGISIINKRVGEGRAQFTLYSRGYLSEMQNKNKSSTTVLKSNDQQNTITRKLRLIY